MLNRIRQEPALVSGLVLVLLNLAAAFGANLTGEQTAAINAVVGAVLALVVRSQVAPVNYPDEKDEGGAMPLWLAVLAGVALVLLILALIGHRVYVG